MYTEKCDIYSESNVDSCDDKITIGYSVEKIIYEITYDISNAYTQAMIGKKDILLIDQLVLDILTEIYDKYGKESFRNHINFENFGDQVNFLKCYPDSSKYFLSKMPNLCYKQNKWMFNEPKYISYLSKDVITRLLFRICKDINLTKKIERHISNRICLLIEFGADIYQEFPFECGEISVLNYAQYNSDLANLMLECYNNFLLGE